ncbi:hypothetical protein PR003_g24364 [Phytophthora rubi]|uniref:Uncharacterized protein n=1 Tax=Phytophthora rubi TaxID=129364 RepID=A0A6A4CRW3_9STRA|nr:hypothetical protein PR001_g29850 [Phytophthora rubi]KAE9294021.1 hypothetical protein PR003_g24364 [Phytophthora rubi]
MTAAASPDDIVNKQTPAHVQAKEDGAMSPELMDVFCEKGSDTLAADLGEMLTPKDPQATVAHKPKPVFAVLLPTTKLILKLAREHDVPVVLGSDSTP